MMCLGKRNIFIFGLIVSYSLVQCRLLKIEPETVYDVRNQEIGSIFSLYPRECTGGCRGGQFIDFGIEIDDGCPTSLKWDKEIENEKNTPCFNETRKVCSYCML